MIAWKYTIWNAAGASGAWGQTEGLGAGSRRGSSKVESQDTVLEMSK